MNTMMLRHEDVSSKFLHFEWKRTAKIVNKEENRRLTDAFQGQTTTCRKTLPGLNFFICIIIELTGIILIKFDLAT